MQKKCLPSARVAVPDGGMTLKADTRLEYAGILMQAKRL